MRWVAVLGTLAPVGCRPAVQPVGEEARAMTVQKVKVSPAGAGYQASWEASVHSCDPVQELRVRREKGRVDIQVLTIPQPTTCTTEPSHWEAMSVNLPPNLFPSHTPTDLYLNGQKVGAVTHP